MTRDELEAVVEQTILKTGRIDYADRIDTIMRAADAYALKVSRDAIHIGQDNGHVMLVHDEGTAYCTNWPAHQHDGKVCR